MGVGRDLFGLRRDGTEVPIEIGLNPIHTDAGMAVRAAIVDITERKRSEQALKDLNTNLEQRVRERTAELEHRAEQLARLSSQLTVAEECERRRLAQVRHDHLQQLLVAMKPGLEVVMPRVDEKQREQLKRVQSLLDESIKASRSLTVIAERNPRPPAVRTASA